MLLLLSLLVHSIVARYTETMMFSDQKYADMTLQTANETFRLARRNPLDFRENVRLTINTLDETNCNRFRPFHCVATGIHWRGSDYFDLIASRLVVMLSVLQYPSDNIDGVLLLDSDVVLFRNVVDRMARYGTDMVFQRELPCSSVNCVNGGVWWARAHKPDVVRLITYALRLMRSLNIPDQDALDIAIDAYRNVSVTYLPVSRYPNGFVYDTNDRLSRSHVHLVHVNWRNWSSKEKMVMGQALPVPARNKTLACNLLERLDALNLARVLGCRTTRTCRMRLDMVCSQR